MTAKTKSFWMLTLKVDHKYFTEFGPEGRTGRIGVADDSGKTPDDTDDGPLYLDRERPILISSDNNVRIPLRDADGKETATPGSFREALCVAERFKMEIRAVFGGRFKVSQV